MIKRTIYQRIVQYGNEAQITQYYKPIYVHDSPNTPKYRNNSNQRRFDSVSRTRTSLYRRIYANIGQHGKYQPVFITLTYKLNQTNLKIANQDFRLFIKRLNYHQSTKLHYVCIPEFQKRGAVHYHAVFFNLPFSCPQKIQNIWRHGFTRIETVQKIRNISAYLTKYLTKEILDNRTKGHRLLLTSQGLQKPKIYDNEQVTEFNNHFQIKKTKSTFTSDLKKVITVELCK